VNLWQLIFNNLAEISSRPRASSDLSDFIIFSITEVVNFLLRFLSVDLCICDTDCKRDYYYCSIWIISVLCASVIIINVNVISYCEKIAINPFMLEVVIFGICAWIHIRYLEKFKEQEFEEKKILFYFIVELYGVPKMEH